MAWRSAAAVAANISSSCCTAGDRPRTKGWVTKTTYIFSTQFQTLKGKRDLPAGPASIIPSTNTMLGPLADSSCVDVVQEGSRRCAPTREHVLLNYSRVTVRTRERKGVERVALSLNYARGLIRYARGPRGALSGI